MCTTNLHNNLTMTYCTCTWLGFRATAQQSSSYAAGNVLLGQSIEDLGQLAQDTGQSAYRGKQLYDGLLHGVRQIDQFNQVCRQIGPTLSCRCIEHLWPINHILLSQRQLGLCFQQRLNSLHATFHSRKLMCSSKAQEPLQQASRPHILHLCLMHTRQPFIRMHVNLAQSATALQPPSVPHLGCHLSAKVVVKQAA